jgi:RNA polymerase subunit RPABC4/transcription elongation factor Spt4
VAFGTSTAPVTIHSVNVTFVAPWSFNLTVSGAGSTLTAADTSLDMNWNATPGLVGAPPYVPWDSNKVVLSDGGRAFLANVSVPEALPLDYQHQSFVVPDAASSATFYRWLEVPVRGAGGIIVQGASVQAQYAYTGATSENATVTAANAFATADPALAQYLAQWDASEGISTYGEVDAQGNATLLVASGEVTSVTLPDGNFLGDYHVGVTANPGSVAVTQWLYASVPAYPYDLQPTGPNATAPTSTATVTFPQYRVSVSAGTPTFALTGVEVTNDSTAVGQPLTVEETVMNTGTGTASTYSATLLLSTPSHPLVQIGPTQSFSSLGPGASRTIYFNWTVNGTTVGDQANGVFSTFTVAVTWNPGAGSVNASKSLTIFPPYISFNTQGPPSTLTIGNSYVMHVFVSYAGNGTAVLNILAHTPTGDELSIAAQRTISPGETNLSVILESSIAPGTYSLTASVVHDNRTAWHNVTDAFVIPSATPPSPTPWYDQTFLGLPLWIWIVIAAAIAAGVGLFLWISVQKAKGKVVECGECGAMIPETAVACPECGAEFESDRVRCSRCGSTIPGNSAVCPECAATLLGRAGEEKDDPERQGYADFVERFRVEGRKALGDSYSESAFWDWWKRQSTYVPFGQWKMQQAQGSRVGMSAPRESAAPAAPPTAKPPSRPPPPGAAPPLSAKPTAPPAATPAPAPAPEPEAAAPAGMITCSNCHKEIPAGYLVCPFCGAVTQ